MKSANLLAVLAFAVLTATSMAANGQNKDQDQVAQVNPPNPSDQDIAGLTEGPTACTDAGVVPSAAIANQLQDGDVRTRVERVMAIVVSKTEFPEGNRRFDDFSVAVKSTALALVDEHAKETLSIEGLDANEANTRFLNDIENGGDRYRDYKEDAQSALGIVLGLPSANDNATPASHIDSLPESRKLAAQKVAIKTYESVKLAHRLWCAKHAALSGIATLDTAQLIDAAAVAADVSPVKATQMRKIATTNREGGDSKYLALLGTVQSLEANGGFESGLEAALISETELWKPENFPVLPSIPLLGEVMRHTNGKGQFEITYSQIGAIQEASGEDGMADPTNPFEVGGGFTRINTHLSFYDRKPDGTSSPFGFQIGAGLTTEPSESQGDLGITSRFFAGPVFNANFGKDENGRAGTGSVAILYVKDKFWERTRSVPDAMPIFEDRSDRIVLDARIDIPGIFATEQVRLFGRAFADIHTGGNGPGDIRISLLFSVDLGQFFPSP